MSGDVFHFACPHCGADLWPSKAMAGRKGNAITGAALVIPAAAQTARRLRPVTQPPSERMPLTRAAEASQPAQPCARLRW